jgi:hypothetical protein
MYHRKMWPLATKAYLGGLANKLKGSAAVARYRTRSIHAGLKARLGGMKQTVMQNKNAPKIGDNSGIVFRGTAGSD